MGSWGEIWGQMRRSGIEKDGVVSILPFGPQTILEASRGGYRQTQELISRGSL